MDAFATSGFELSALLAPELAGTVTSVSQGLRGDPRAPDSGAAPFALALAAAAPVAPEAATLPESGKILPLFTHALVAADVVDSASAPVRQPLDAKALETLVSGSSRTVSADVSAALPTIATAKTTSIPIAVASDPIALPTAAPSAATEPASSSPGPATLPVDATAAKLAATNAEPESELVRLLAKQVDSKQPEPVIDAPAERSGEQVTRPASQVRDTVQPPVPELLRSTPSTVTAAESASVSAAMPVARNLQLLDAGARGSETGAATPTVTAIVTDANSSPSVEVPKLTAELPAGNEARLPGALAERLHWMIDHNLGEARIKLNPPQLGAIDIKITLADDQTFVQFTASQAGARDAIEAAIPRLRDLLGAAGLALGGATVGGETTSREQPELRWNAVPELEPLDVSEPVSRTAHPAAGLIDIYA